MVTERDYKTHENYDYVIETWSIGPAADNYFETVLETQRVFYLLRPVTFTAETRDVPMLVFLHGGAVGDDSSEDYYDVKDPYTTNCGLARNVAKATLFGPMALNDLTMARGWVTIAPENLWCDFWVGRGESDPVDTENHKSYVHVTEVMDFMHVGGGGFVPTKTYLWGTSSGGAGSMPISHWYEGGVDGVIADSPPCNMLSYYDDDKRSLEHIFGGPPFDDEAGTIKSKWHQNYLDPSCTWLVSDDNYSVPIFVPYNSQDQLTATYNTTALSDNMDTYLASAGVRYGHHDFDHASPGSTYHVQSVLGGLPGPYTTELMLRFLEGKELFWTEAESSCLDGDCLIGDIDSEIDNPDYKWEKFSKAAGRSVSASAGTGVALSEPLPEAIGNGDEITATIMVVTVDIDALEPKEVVFVIEYEEAGVSKSRAEIVSTDLATQINNSGVNIRTHIQATELNFVVENRDLGKLTVTVNGKTDLNFDGVVYQR
jgi:hypothetical protein